MKRLAWWTRTCVVLHLLVLLVTGCGGPPAATLVTPPAGTSAPTEASPATTASGVGGPSLAFERPTDGSSVPAGDLAIRVAVGGFGLVDKIGKPPTPGEGHIVFYVGVDFIPTRPGRPALTAPGTFAVSAQPEYTWSNLTSGTNRIAAQLVNNDDSPLQPPVTASANVTVQ